MNPAFSPMFFAHSKRERIRCKEGNKSKRKQKKKEKKERREEEKRRGREEKKREEKYKEKRSIKRREEGKKKKKKKKKKTKSLHMQSSNRIKSPTNQISNPSLTRQKLFKFVGRSSTSHLKNNSHTHSLSFSSFFFLFSFFLDSQTRKPTKWKQKQGENL